MKVSAQVATMFVSFPNHSDAEFMNEQFKANEKFKTSWESKIKDSCFKAIACQKFQERKRKLLLAVGFLKQNPSAPDEVIRTLLDNGTISQPYSSEIDARSDQPASGVVGYFVNSFRELIGSPSYLGSYTGSGSGKTHGKAKQSRYSLDDAKFLAKANKIALCPVLTESVVGTLKLARDYLQQQVAEATVSLKTLFIGGLKTQLHKQSEREVKRLVTDEETKNIKTFLLAAEPVLSKLEENADQWVHSVDAFERKN
jgi:hypothetical protein